MTQKREQNANKFYRLFEWPERRRGFMVQWSVKEHGRRKVKTRGFCSNRERMDFVRELERLRENFGTEALKVDPVRYRELVELEARAGAPMRDVVAFYLERKGAGAESVPDAVERFLESRTGGFDYDQEIHMESRTRLFASAFKYRKLEDLAVDDCQKWLDGLGRSLAPVTVKNYRIAVNAALNWLVKRGELSRNVMALTRSPRIEQCEKSFYSCREALRFFRVNETEDPSLCGLVALLAFAGLRTSAMLRMVKKDVRLSPRGILSRAANAKSGRRHFIEHYPENLWPWVALIDDKDWGMPMERFYARRRRAYARAGIENKSNGWRHSFASHHSAMCGSATETAYLLQHRSVQMLWETYKGNCSKRNGTLYFRIVPRGGG